MQKCIENRPKINITSYGENFYQLTYLDQIKIWRVTFLKQFIYTEQFWDGLPVFRKQLIAFDMTYSLDPT